MEKKSYQGHYLQICSLIFVLLSVPFCVCANPPPGISLISCNQSGVVIELQLPELQEALKAMDGEVFTDLSLADWGRILEEGKPALPQAGLLIALPPGASANLAIEVLQTRTEPINNPLPAPTLERDPVSLSLSESYLLEPAIYASPQTFPNSWATLGEPTWLRSYWVVPLRITPVRARCAQGEALIAEHLKFHITFQGGREGGFIPDPHGEGLAQMTILNYSQARAWQERGSGPPPRVPQSLGQYKILVEHDGLHAIDYYDLLEAGIDPTSIDPRTFKIALQGQEIPIWVEGQDDQSFDPDDYILFYGYYARGTYTYDNIYTSANVYWLDWGGTLFGVRIGQAMAAPGIAPLASVYQAGYRMEVDTLYEAFGDVSTMALVDHWMWLLLRENENPEFSLLLNPPGLVTEASRMYNLKVAVRGLTINDSLYPDHRLNVEWNNQEVIDVTFDGQYAVVGSGSLSGDYVTTSVPNEIVIKTPNVPDMFANSFYIDWIQLDYWRNFSVQNDTLLFQSPQDMGAGDRRYQLTGLQDSVVELWNLSRMERLIGYDFNTALGTLAFQDSASDTTYYIIAGKNHWLQPELIPDEPSDLLNTANGVDYLIISHENFYSTLAPLISHYQGQGKRVMAAKVGDVYDEFSYGLKTPQAIFDFIQYAYYNFQAPVLTYVLLVGDASWDYKDKDSQPYVDYVPTHSFQSYKWGETASDNWFAAVTGTEDRPDLFVSRFPVNTADEAQTMVEKSLLYSDAPPGNWRSQIIFTNGAYATVDAAFFDSTAQLIIDKYFPSWYDPPRVYSKPSPGYEQYLATSQDLIGYINSGAAMVNYIGHAGNQMWETLTQPQISLLTNGPKLPFVASFSCFTGIFSNTKGFGEEFVLHPDGGAIAYWSNAGIGFMFNNYFMNDFLFDKLFAVDTLTTFGEIVTAAKWNYYFYYGNTGDAVKTFTLMGDPAAAFAFIPPNPADTLDVSAPQITITGPGDVFRNGDFTSNNLLYTSGINVSVYDTTEVDTSSLSMALTRHTPFAEWSLYPDTTNALQSLGLNLSLTYSGPDTSGHSINMNLKGLFSESLWTLEVSARDVLLNGPISTTMDFTVDSSLAIRNVLNYPNPFVESTHFTYELSRPAQVKIKVYTVSGKLLSTLTAMGDVGYNVIEWNGRDQQGDPLSNGAYLYKIVARDGSYQVEKVEKMARIR
ncbi:MAG: C25 family cysteine peptidase [bacterium]